ncbi:hypothetical protein QLQ12_13480 [Actinoplanes sp. NEAU-A12]|uniref:Ig-like domain-containing protein n=1 Tax=Actinoplanes sandaracinus TaxID=3045177 RepID=A0ABT6WIQ7_9ACTN|nr:hypothetical protein [Actinoplanes sandaracinus]MDI6099609.1 hypothetical protein [Actinoplanes sandaracinus]
MTRPEEPLGDRAMPPPADPWATIDRPVPTVYLGDPDTTVDVGSSDRTAQLPGPNPAAHVTPTAPTVRIPPPAPTAQGASTAATVHGFPTAPTVQGSPTAPTVHRSPTAPTVHLGSSAPTVRAEHELRFGPGVPPAPVATPGWPATPTAGRRRPLWRRLVSLLSSLLTLALVVVVGFYVWQRLRPLVVESATVTVPRPAGNRCDVTVDVVATVSTNGRSGVIRYQWFRSNASPGVVLTEQVGSGQRTATLTLQWTFSGVGTTTETATVNIIEPSPLQAGTPVAYRCRRG